MSIDIPNYRIIQKLGEGAQSHIYRARCMPTGQDYAVKIVKKVKPEDEGFIELLRTEYTIGSAIKHPVVRGVYELRYLRQRLRVRGAILFMEYVDGIPMSEKEFKRPLDEVLKLFCDVARGLQAIHQAGFVHADLKPNNILVQRDGSVKLIDFGQSAVIHEAKPRVQGTIDYIAPEQVQRGKLDQRTDVFGLGATLHKVLTGKAIPTEMNQTVSIHSSSLIGRRVSEIRAATMQDLPLSVARLIDDCCQIRPEDRLADVSTFIERVELIRAILAKQGSAAPVVDHDDREDEVDLGEGHLTARDMSNIAAEAERLLPQGKVVPPNSPPAADVC